MLTDTWRRLKPYFTGKKRCQYLTVDLVSNGKRVQKKVHTLILEAFVGPCPDGMVGCHENDNREDNRLSNLRWGTQKSNMEDRGRNGTTAMGSRSGASKLNEEQVLQIRNLAFSGLSNAEIARNYGCSAQMVSDIVAGRHWTHVGGPIRNKWPPKRRGVKVRVSSITEAYLQERCC